jgi:(p)ppGpp synthase/HD superfamily hydrolase
VCGALFEGGQVLGERGQQGDGEADLTIHVVGFVDGDVVALHHHFQDGDSVSVAQRFYFPVHEWVSSVVEIMSREDVRAQIKRRRLVEVQR